MAEYQVFLSILPSLIFSPKAYSEGFFSALRIEGGYVYVSRCVTVVYISARNGGSTPASAVNGGLNGHKSTAAPVLKGGLW